MITRNSDWLKRRVKIVFIFRPRKMGKIGKVLLRKGAVPLFSLIHSGDLVLDIKTATFRNFENLFLYRIY